MRLGPALTLDPGELRVGAVAVVAGGAALAAAPDHPFTCPLRALTGVPCPLCGMTTSVEATMTLQLGDAFAAHPGGLVLVVAALAVLLAGRPPSRIPVVAVALLLAAGWLFQLVRFGVV